MQTLMLQAQISVQSMLRTAGHVSALLSPPHLLLTSLEVEPWIRHQGIGRNLVRSLLQQLEIERLECAYVYTDKLRFFGRLGFKPVRGNKVPRTISPMTTRQGYAQWLVIKRCTHPCDWQGVMPKFLVHREKQTSS